MLGPVYRGARRLKLTDALVICPKIAGSAEIPPNVPRLPRTPATRRLSRCMNGWKPTVPFLVGASRHRNMVPIGFALEDFDAIGGRLRYAGGRHKSDCAVALLWAGGLRRTTHRL
jgi:hypothetical protein